MSRIPLGQSTEYPEEYAPGVLFAVARAESREKLGLGSTLPFHGTDIWNAWELTWLDLSGKPCSATATFRFDADSSSIVESKSLKLYLGSFAMSRFDSTDELADTIATDLGKLTGSDVDVRITDGSSGRHEKIDSLPGVCVDDLPCDSPRTAVDSGVLRHAGGDPVSGTLHSHLLRSLCPVTNQPDYGSVLIHYHGPRIEPSSFLEYVVSYRRHQAFHEACVEQMFLDISASCLTNKLTVYARYTRRGGIDINPFRSDFEENPENLRLWRQ